MPAQLSIASKPYKSSFLAIPPSPFSPRFPIRLSSLRPSAQQTKSRPSIELPAPPSEPLNWLWQCHLCNRVYQLGVTRRCLDDGHFFCAGSTSVKKSRRTGAKRTVRHKACASEFDYQGWKAWSTWRRDVAEQIAAAEALEEFLNEQPMSISVPTVPVVSSKSTRGSLGKDCWNVCDYPSECRWGKQYGVSTPVISVTPPTATVPSSPASESEKKVITSFDDILLDVTLSKKAEESEPTSEMSLTLPEEGDKQPSMDDLLDSAKRRKRRSAGQVPSPLASKSPSPIQSEFPESHDQVLQKALDDFDLDMRKTFGEGGAVVSSIRNSAALEDEKAEAFVAGLKPSRKRFLGRG